jgi:AAA ATPase domain
METRAAPSGSLFGRERELARIHGLLDATATGPAGLMLEGAPGIGKTTIWRAGVAAALERGRFVLQARPAQAECDLSFSGLGDLLQPALEHLGTLAPPRRRALEAALFLASHETPDARVLGLATIDLLHLLAEERPVMVAIDDTQWLDRPSRDTLAYAFRRFQREPVALLSTRRPGGGSDALGDPELVSVGPFRSERFTS